MYLATTISPLLTKILSISFIRKVRGCANVLTQPLLYFTVLLYFLLAMLLFPHAFGNKLLYSNYIGL